MTEYTPLYNMFSAAQQRHSIHDSPRMDKESSLLYGYDFTSAPQSGKVIVARANWQKGPLQLLDFIKLNSRATFTEFITCSPPFIGGFDFPFGLPREFITDQQWPESWPDVIRQLEQLGKAGFKTLADDYRQQRPMGKRSAHRRCDALASSHSPLKFVNPPGGAMLFTGMHAGDPPLWP